MSLRDEVHRLIDELDAHQLTLLHERMKQLNLITTVGKTDCPVVTREDVLKLTASDNSNWSDDIIAAREDRV